MASSSFHLLLLCLVYVISSCVAKTSHRPILQVTKDAKTLQYVTQISQRTPLVPVKLTIDLGGLYMWVNCEHGYTSSTYHPARCGSASCQLLNTTSCNTKTSCRPQIPGCYNNTCQHVPFSAIASEADYGDIGSEVFKIHSTNGTELSVPNFYFLCGTNRISKGLAIGVTGMAGLGRTQASLPSQLASYFSFDNKFALCLSSSNRSSGVVLFGDVSNTSLTYTPLIVNHVNENGFFGDASANYFIGVKSIKIKGKLVKGFNTTLFSFDGRGLGLGGTSISTVDPYTVLETSIYKAVVAAFEKAMPKSVEKVANVAPFGACFSSKNIGSTRLGPDVPSIDLELQSKNVWRINGANATVEVKKNVLCLGFVESGRYTKPSIVIGAHQIEDNLLEFDLSASRLGFSSSLLGGSTSCANFKFT